MKDASPARACGIDFGTSNSTVGWLRPGMETMIALEDDKITLPSVVFFNIEERRPVYGRLALHEYLEGYEGRLMRSLKSLLGSKLIKHDTSVLGTAMPFKDLLGLFIGQLKSRAETAAGREFEQVVLGRPVFFVDDDPLADQEAEDTLVEVARKHRLQGRVVPVRTDRCGLRLRVDHRKRRAGADRRHRRWYLRLLAGAPVARASRPWTTVTMTSSPPAACTSAGPISTNS